MTSRRMVWEAASAGGIRVFGIKTVRELCNALAGIGPAPKAEPALSMEQILGEVAYDVDFDEAMRRQTMYKKEETDANEHHKCRIGRGR